MTTFSETTLELQRAPKTWLVTGVAGFIGSNLLEWLLRAGQRVVGMDNLSTGFRHNLEDVRSAVGAEAWGRFRFIEGDVTDEQACRDACAGVDYVLHQAALGSVPRSINAPLVTNRSNVDGFLSIIWAAKEAGVRRFVFASSSSVYGDHPGLPKIEDRIGTCLSPYAVSKRVGELYAEVFGRCYGVEWIGLRYFNVFGPRQTPDGPYAAVIPKWIASMLRTEPVFINGDGATSRDFCFVANTIQANVLAATTTRAGATKTIYNIAAGGRTTLNDLFEMLRSRLEPRQNALKDFKPTYRDFRSGDVAHSHADISKAAAGLGYAPTHSASAGLDAALDWYVANIQPA